MGSTEDGAAIKPNKKFIDSRPVKNKMSKAKPSTDEVLQGEKIPSDEAFEKWFDDLTIEELDRLWKYKKVKDKITTNLRAGNNHEWYLVSNADIAKKWGVTAKEIKQKAVTEVNTEKGHDLWFIDIEVPKGKKFAKEGTINGRHGDGGKNKDTASEHSSKENSASTRAHMELAKLMEESKTKEEYLQKLNKWADKHLVSVKKDSDRNKKENIVARRRKVLPDILQR